MKKILLSILTLCCMTAAWAQGDGFIEVNTTKKLWDAITADNSAKVRLTADIALSDIDKDGETYCNTFSGTIDGNGHTIKGDPVASVRARTYMFENANGATFKNLTFKGIRVNSENNSNQAIITAKADNGCVFENITFENVHTWTNYDNTGSVAGWARDCTFRDITVRNSDFTADQNQAGAVVGHALECGFSNIRVENCEVTSAADGSPDSDHGKSGGVAGCSDDGSFFSIEILGTFVKSYRKYAGGVVGYSYNNEYWECSIDDQSCVCVKGSKEGVYFHRITFGYAGGIAGGSDRDTFYGCINSALIASGGINAGGIVGAAEDIPNDIVNISRCVNTGMVIAMDMDKVGDLYNKYKNKTGMTCVTKTYRGKEYVIRKYDKDDYDIWVYFAGIVGEYRGRGEIDRCVNFGSIYSKGSADEGVLDSYTCGGIAGWLGDLGTICGCLSDFSGDSGASGICGVTYYGKVKNCLNTTTYRDYRPYHDKWEYFSGENNYSLTTASGIPSITKTTKSELKTGKIGHLLGSKWQQNVGTDPYPIPSDNGFLGIYHTRVVNNQYGTVCLPYYLKPNNEISYYRIYENRLRDDLTVLRFKYIEEVAPGHPVLFLVKNFNGTSQEVTFKCEGGDLGFADTPQHYDGGYNVWGMGGAFEETVFTETTQIPSSEVYYLSNGVIKNAKKTTIAPFRAFFYRPDLEKLGFLAKSIQIEIEDKDGTTTALELVGDDLVPVQDNGKTYSLMGTEVGEGYHGIVIKNGKKMIQKR